MIDLAFPALCTLATIPGVAAAVVALDREARLLQAAWYLAGDVAYFGRRLLVVLGEDIEAELLARQERMQELARASVERGIAQARARLGR